MKTTTAILALIGMFLADSALADYSVSNRGAWPESWPKEMEPLRDHAKTLEGPLILFRHHLIPFKDRTHFEAAWPHILKVKSAGAPIILVPGPKTDFFKLEPAGVYIHVPPRRRIMRKCQSNRPTCGSVGCGPLH